MRLNFLSRTLSKVRRFDRHSMDRLSRRLMTGLRGEDLGRADGRCNLSPEWLILGVNNVCNLHCKMCDVGLGESNTVFWANLIGDQPHNMTLDLLNEILHQARAFRPRPRIGLPFTEPLIHPKIVDFVRAIVGQGFYCAITSNGSALPRLADSLVEAGVHEITISVDGPAAVHNRIRGGRDSFEKLYRGVELVNAAKARLKRRHPIMRFSFTVTDENWSHILEFIQAVESLHPATINISQLNFITEGMAQAHNTSYAGDLAVVRSNLGVMDPAAFDTDAIWAELQRVRTYVRSRGSAFPVVSVVPDLATREGLETFYREPATFVGGRECADPWKMMMIKTDGAVIPAHGRCYNFPIGNIRTSPLPELWNNDRFRTFRQTLSAGGGTLPACSRCCGIIGKPAESRTSPSPQPA